MNAHLGETPELFKYVGQVREADGKLSNKYVDWFANDDDAQAGYRLIMAEQGCKVKSVIIENRTAIVEIE